MLFWIITTASNVVIQNFDLHTLKQKQVLTNLPLLFYCRLPTAIGRPLPIADSNSKTQQNAMYTLKILPKCHLSFWPAPGLILKSITIKNLDKSILNMAGA